MNEKELCIIGQHSNDIFVLETSTKPTKKSCPDENERKLREVVNEVTYDFDGVNNEELLELASDSARIIWQRILRANFEQANELPKEFTVSVRQLLDRQPVRKPQSPDRAISVLEKQSKDAIAAAIKRLQAAMETK